MCQIDLRAPLLLRVSVLKNIPHQNPFFNTDTQRSGVTQREKLRVSADNGYTAAYCRHIGGYFDNVIVGANGLVNALILAIPGFGVAG